ncbi:MAG: (dimethylallyl)adenosine tRNA methylthiotransferase [Microgenomates group bacterium GW2011_GWA2_40_6]|nr:MAG: (dimethylallyl)adenosine tRNA methylthiotransferase [Microgenomates group bacterium GW2011_GWA2_40_6]
MNRPYDNLKIKKLIKNCKLKIKNLSLGTDIIVAFPGETESDFKETLSLCKNIGFQKIHTFRFSPRDYTPAQLLFKKAPQISKSDVSTRAELIRQLCIHQT